MRHHDLAVPPAPSRRPAMTTTYLAQAARDQLDRAQADIDAHVRTRYGFCTACGELAPCTSRTHASALFARYHSLPRRRPGHALGGADR